MEILLTEYENINPALTTIFPCTSDNYYVTFLAFYIFEIYLKYRAAHSDKHHCLYPINIISVSTVYFFFLVMPYQICSFKTNTRKTIRKKVYF